MPETAITKRLVRDGETMLAMMPGADPDKPVLGMIKATPDGVIQKVMTKVPLRADRDETWEMMVWDPVTRTKKNKTAITVPGYNRLNQFANISLLKPKTAINDAGEVTNNPHFERVGTDIRAVTLKMIGVGRAVATGQPMRIDYTLRYDLHLYFMQDVWAKWAPRKEGSPVKSWGQAFRIVPDDIQKDPTKLILDGPSGLFLILDLTNKEVLNLFHEHIGRQKFAERNCQSICARNIIKHFVASVVPDSDGKVAIVSWTTGGLDLATVKSLAEADEDNVGEGDVETTVVTEMISDPQAVDEALQGGLDEEESGLDESDDGPASVAPTASAPASQADPEKQLADELRTKIRHQLESKPRLKCVAVFTKHKWKIDRLADLLAPDLLDLILADLMELKPTK